MSSFKLTKYVKFEKIEGNGKVMLEAKSLPIVVKNPRGIIVTNKDTILKTTKDGKIIWFTRPSKPIKLNDYGNFIIINSNNHVLISGMIKKGKIKLL